MKWLRFTDFVKDLVEKLRYPKVTEGIIFRPGL